MKAQRRTSSCRWFPGRVLLAAGTIVAGSAAHAAPPVPAAVLVESFESDTPPAGWATDGDGELAVTPDRFKSGSKSLRWSWRATGSAVTITPSGGRLALPKDRSLAVWVHNDTPLEKLLRVEFLRDGEVIGRGWYVLNFQGWRPLGAPYSQVLVPPPADGPPPICDAIRFVAPDGVPKGLLHVDLVALDCPDVLKPDNQQPWVGKPEVLGSATPEAFIWSMHDIAKNRPWLPVLPSAAEITAADRRDMDLIRERVLVGDSRKADNLHKGERIMAPDIHAARDATALAEFRDLLKLRRSADGAITGVPIAPPVHGHFGLKVFNSPPDGVAVATFPDAVTPLLRRVVSTYLFEKRAGNAAAADELRQAVVDFYAHLLDQGFAEGNNNVSTYGIDMQCLVTMRDELAAAGLLRDALLAAAACSLRLHGDVLMVEDWSKTYYYHRDTDLQRDYRPLLCLTALLPDEAERLQRLRAYSRAVSSLLDPDLGEPYAWDGTGHHHPLFHLAYTAGAGFFEAYNLSGTQFRLAPRAIATLKKSVMLMACATGRSSTLPPNVPGYTGVPLGIILAFNSLRMAHADTAEARDGIDPDVAGIYLGLAGDKPDDIHVAKFRERGIEPWRFEGNLPLNGAAIALHRRGDWLVSIAGEHRFRRNHEANVAYVGSNYNHYSRHGSVFVVSQGDPVSPWRSGYALEGWDPRHVPGTTAYLAENEVALWRRGSIPLGSFGGGTELDGDGIWGCDLRHESERLPDNLTFRKSAFCFGDRITLVTSDIGRGPKAGPAERGMPVITTLFQNTLGEGGTTAETGGGEGRFGAFPPPKPPAVKPEDHPCWVDGDWVASFPHETTLPPGRARLLVDNKGTAYHVPADAPPLRVARREQKWTYFREYWAKPHARFPKGDPRNYKVGPGKLEDYEPTVDTYAVAWFEHGPDLATTACTYTLMPRSTPEAVRAFALAMESPDTAPVAILQRDARAHVARDRPSRTTGYVAFASGPLAAPGHVREVNRPCAVMVKETADGLRMSVASTDLDDWPVWAGGKIGISGDIVLTLAGGWNVTAGDATAARVGDATSVTIPFRTFLPVVLALESAAP